MRNSCRSRRTRDREQERRPSSGFSPSADRVLVVIAYRDLDGDWHGMNVWPASGRDLAAYLEEAADE